MAKQVLRATNIKLAPTGDSLVDYSGQVSEVTLSIEVSTDDGDNFESDDWSELVAIGKSATVQINFKRDADMGGLDAVLFANLGLELDWQIEPDGGVAVGATNPFYSGRLLVTQWTPIGGQVRQLHQTSVSWPVVGPVTRTTS